MSSKRRTTSPQRRRNQSPLAKAPWWKRPLVWVGGVLSALALGAAGAFGAGLGQSLFSTTAGQHPTVSDMTTSPSAAPLPTTSTSASGLDVLSSTFYVGAVDTFFVTKNAFQPTGQIAAALLNTPSAAWLPIFHNAGAINQRRTVLRLVFTGESPQGVRILNISPIILKRAAPWHGDLFAFGAQGEAPTVRVSLDLDSAFPTVMDSVTGQPYFEEKTITLQRGEQEVAIIRVTATRGFVAYALRIDYLVGTNQRDVIIEDHGQPFKLSAVNCVRKNIEWYGRVYTGPVANVSEGRLPSQEQSTCTPN